MGKGKLGISFKFYAVLALVFALFGSVQLCALLLAFVLLVEKDEWTGRQCMQALFLSLVYDVQSAVTNFIYGTERVMNMFGTEAYTIFNNTQFFVALLFKIVMLLFALIGIMNVLKGQDASVPLFSGWAAKAYGFVQPRMQPPAPPYQGYPPQGGQPTYGQPVPGQGAPVQPPVAPSAPTQQNQYGQPQPPQGQPPVPPNY